MNSASHVSCCLAFTIIVCTSQPDLMQLLPPYEPRHKTLSPQPRDYGVQLPRLPQLITCWRTAQRITGVPVILPVLQEQRNACVLVLLLQLVGGGSWCEAGALSKYSTSYVHLTKKSRKFSPYGVALRES